ncbi:MAG: TonB-dependent siderophore receptor [Opitutaceae bacterium]
MAAWPVSAQTPATKDETVILSAFEVRAEATSRYQVSEASSGGRIRLNLMDTPASLTVITKELLEDVGADRLLDALKYTSGVTESITPNGLERVTLRGFQSDFTVMDGFRTNTGQMNFDPAIMDRVEVMKGPNAILQPQGTPGGTVNGVTKNPTLGESSGRASLQAGRFDANRATFDYNGVAVPNKLAYRLVLAGQYSDGWWDATHTHRYMINPGVLYQFGPSTRLVVKGYFSDYRVQTYGGVPIDPAVGTRDKLRIFPGLDRRSNMRGPGEQRVDNREEGTFFLTSRMGDHLSVRLAGRLANLTTNAFGTNPGGLSAGGAVNPLNGEWVGGTVFGPAPTFTPAPAPAVNPVAVRSGGDNTNFVKVTNLQNDYAFQYDFKSVKTTTTAGIAYTDFSVISFGRVGNRGVLDIRNTRATQNAPTVFGPITSYNFSTLEEVQLYGQEQASFFADRLIVSGGASTNRVKSTRRREITAPGLVEVSPARNLDSFSYGLVYKPAPSVSLYFGHSANAVARVSFTGSLAPAEITTAEGVQDEAGVKLSFAEGRVFVTLAYFDLRQTNFVVANPLNFASPPPSPPLPNLLFDRVSKGWEVNVNATLTKELAIMGNYYHGKNRDPNGIPFQASADDSGGLFARYDFSQPALKGLGCSLGVDYLGRRPGIQASGVTAASTSTNVIYVQPSFYVPARTLLNGAVYYTRGAMRYQLNVDNVLNTKYLTGTFTRTGIWVGTPINFKLSVTREL